MTNDKLGDVFEIKIIPHGEKYYDDETMWGCYLFHTDKKIPGSHEHIDSDNPFSTDDSPIKKFSSILVGKTQRLILNQEYDIKAKFTYNKKYSQYNYEIISMTPKIPKTVDDQKLFLMSIITGKQAETLCAVYPNIVNDVVNGKENIDFSKTKGIKEHTWKRIREKILENYVLSDILMMLIPLGISINKIQKLLSRETNPMVLKEKLLDNPYIIIDIPGIGFRQADKIAIGLKPELKVSRERVSAFVIDYLRKEGSDNGHTWIYVGKLIDEVDNMISDCNEVFQEIYNEQLENSTFLFIEDDKIGLSSYKSIEDTIMDVVTKFNESEPLDISEERILDGIADAEKQQGFKFTAEQRETLIQIINSNFNIITGKAGVGKTTIVRGLLNIYRKSYTICSVALSAKAAKRIEEATGHGSSTIHRLLGATGLNEFSFNKNIRLPFDIVIVDEASMINARIMKDLLVAVKDGAKIVLCGDAKQLPPIGFGNVFSDLIENESLQVNYLTKILRQAEASGIISDANKIRDGISPISRYSHKTVHGELQDMYYMFRDNRKALNKVALKMFLSAVDEVGVDNTFILVPRKNNCLNSTQGLNKQIQDALLDKDLPSITIFDKEYRVGCKVIHRVNNYDKNIFNGEIGYIKSLDKKSAEIDYDGKIIRYTKSELKQIDHAYALTTHLYQGSEAHTIIGIIDNSHFMLLDATFLYTMITRASKRCLLLAEPYAFEQCIKNNKSIYRQTWIKGDLNE